GRSRRAGERDSAARTSTGGSRTLILQKKNSLRMLALAAMLASFLFAPRVLRAQEGGAPQQKQEDSQSRNPGLQREIVRESNEAADEEDKNEQFKQSSSVRWIAKATGLDLKTAYWLCVILNFAVIGGVIIWAAAKSLPAAFRNRTAAIQ